MENFKKEVDRGYKWLNENHPDWKNKVNVNTLSMSDSENCILGQIFGNYFEAEKVLGKQFCHNNGFSIDDSLINRSFFELTNQWRNLLEETYNLSTDKVKPGFYKVVGVTKTSFSVNEILLVIDPHSNLDIRSDWGNTINCVVDSDYKMFVNCPVIVKKSEIGF